MRRVVLVGGLVLAVLLLAGLGASSLARTVRSKARTRPWRARTATTPTLA